MGRVEGQDVSDEVGAYEVTYGFALELERPAMLNAGGLCVQGEAADDGALLERELAAFRVRDQAGYIHFVRACRWALGKIEAQRRDDVRSMGGSPVGFLCAMACHNDPPGGVCEDKTGKEPEGRAGEVE